MAYENSIEAYQRLFDIEADVMIQTDEEIIETYRMLCNISGLEYMEDDFKALLMKHRGRRYVRDERERMIYEILNKIDS